MMSYTEQGTSFKVYLLKERNGEDSYDKVSRFVIDLTQNANIIEWLHRKLQTIFDDLQGYNKKYTVMWKDYEQDAYITISTQEDLNIALNEMTKSPGSLCKLYIKKYSKRVD